MKTKTKLTIITFCLLLIILSAFVPSAFANNFSETEHQKGIRKLQDSANNVLLTVDVSQNKKKISKYLYGVNIANWCPWCYLNLCAPQLKDAKVTVVRFGATNMERYNYRNNRMFNAIEQKNEYVPMNWKSFIEWCKKAVKAEPFLQTSVYGHVAGEGKTTDDSDYDHKQSENEVKKWVSKAGKSVKFWGVGNEPWIAWKREDYPDPYGDAAHGDQVLNKDTSFDNYFSRFFSLASKIKQANPDAAVFGPTSANWWLYWTNDYSPYCPVTEANADPKTDDSGWETMSDIENQWNREVFPDRGDDPEITGWETDENRVLSQYLIRAREHEEQKGIRMADYMDVHRYIRATTEKDAIQETRGLLEDGYISRDLEVSWELGSSSAQTETKILKRFQNMVDMYYPATKLSFSEYDYFYWNVYPELPQVAAVGQMDFLGFFERMGVTLACNWYVGEPNQSGNTGGKEADSANQAMFNEKGEPNPKYRAFWLMSHHFRGKVVSAESSDWEPYSVGWWDAHGTPEDRDNPYVYRFFLDQTEKPDMGGIASMRIEFNRANGDTKNGRLYLPFGTYGHKTVTTGEDGEEVTYNATGDWSEYESFAFDIKTDTKDSTTTKFLIVISDEDGKKGKPAVGIKSYKDLMELDDDKWQTVTIPLEGIFYFYDWRYPEGPDGSTTQLDFSRITQIEFTPWEGSKKASGTLYLDNLRLIKNTNNGIGTVQKTAYKNRNKRNN